MSINLVTANHETFAPYVNTLFTIETSAGPVTLTLDNVKMFEKSDIRDNHLEIDGVVYPPRRPFALTFVAPREPLLESRIYRMIHAEIGEIELFISPFRQDHDCTLYETVFN